MLTQYITLDFTKKYSAGITVQQYETDGRHFQLTMTSDGTIPIDIASASVTLYATKPDETTDYEACTVLDGAAGKALFVMPSSMCNVAGSLACVVLISVGDETLRSPLFEITVSESPDISGAAASTSQWTALEEALALTTGFDARITANTNNIIHSNLLINSNFLINQLSVSGTVTLSAGQYGHDGWKAGSAGCTYTYSTTANVTTVTITAGTLKQIVEGCNILGEDHTLSWSGTAQGQLSGGGYGASPVTETLTGGSNAEVEFGTGTLICPKLEYGDTATVYTLKPCTEEMRDCQRYYEVLGIGIAAHAGATSLISLNATLRVKKRATPTLEILTSAPIFADIPYSGDYTGSGSTINGYSTSTEGIKFANIDGFTGLTAGKAYICFSNLIGVNARL